MAVLRRNKGVWRQIHALLRGCCTNALCRANQDGDYQVGLGRLDGSEQGIAVNRVNNRVAYPLLRVEKKGGEKEKGEAKKETRKQPMEQASAMYQAESAEEARQRLTAFAQQWRARTPKTVATLERDFEQTIAFDFLNLDP